MDYLVLTFTHFLIYISGRANVNKAVILKVVLDKKAYTMICMTLLLVECTRFRIFVSIVLYVFHTYLLINKSFVLQRIGTYWFIYLQFFQFFNLLKGLQKNFPLSD